MMTTVTSRGRAAILAVAGLLVVSVQETSAQWTQWGGPSRNFKADMSKLADSWPADGPRRLWHRTLGTGYSGIVADGGVIYTMFRKKKSDAHEYTIALDAKSGETLWQKRDLAVVPKDVPDYGKDFTGPNATPLVVGDKLFTVGRNALLQCRDKTTGKLLWKHCLVRKFGAETQVCGYSPSPVAYKNTIILPMGRAEGEKREGDSLVAFDQTTGNVVWKQHTFRIEHASPLLIDLDGEDQFVQCTREGVIGVNPANGDMLWEHKITGRNYSGVFASPVWNGKDTLLFSSREEGHAIKLAKENGKTIVEPLWADKKVPLGQATPILLGDMLVGPKRGGGRSPAFIAVDVQTGERLWLERTFAMSVLIGGGSKILVLGGRGELGLATATRDGLTVHSQCQLTEEYSFTAPVLVGTTLYVRDEKSIMALDLGQPATDGAG